MASPQQLSNLVLAFNSAMAATNLAPWEMVITPEQYAAAAACEAMAESGWLTEMPPNSRNCLGIKAGHHYIGQTVRAAGTEENQDGAMTGPQPDDWRVYPAYTACFADQLLILHTQKLSDGSLAYQAAITAPTVDSYITAECHVWSTSQSKATTVLQIYHAHASTLLA